MSQRVKYRRWMEALKSFEKSDYKNWFEFALLWFSFNGHYSKRYSQIGREKNKIIEFAKDNEGLYEILLTDKQVDFKNVLDEFGETKSQQKRECVKDMKSNTGRCVKFDNENKSCEDFFKVLYQIRCNFFHGDKSSDSKQDRKLVQWAFKYFWIFWERFSDEELKKGKDM